MSTKQQLAEAVAALPDSLTLEEAVERLYHTLKLRAKPASALPTPLNLPTSAHLRQLVDEERISEARALVTEMNEPQWAMALAPAQVKVADRASGACITELAMTPELLAPFVGQWIALRAGQVLGSAPRRADLRRQLAERQQLAGSVFLKVEQ